MQGEPGVRNRIPVITELSRLGSEYREMFRHPRLQPERTLKSG